MITPKALIYQTHPTESKTLNTLSVNICFFSWKEFSGATTPGGVERATASIAKELRRRGHRVEFYYSDPNLHFHIPLVSGLLRSFSPFLIPSFNSEGKRFRQFLKEHKIDVAVWHGNSIWATPLPLKNLPCKLVTSWRLIPFWGEQTCADHLITKLRLHSRFGEWLARSKLCCFPTCKFLNFYRSSFFAYACRHSEKFVLLSEKFFADFAPGEKFPEKVCTIPNIAPFEVQDVPSEKKKKELVWVSRIEFLHKRPDFMLQIWSKLQDRLPDWKLRFVGDGAYMPELKKLSASMGLKNVYFEGFCDPTPYYRSASIFCMTSADEGFPNVLLEAQAYGCVPVAFDSYGAFRDIIDDGVNGYLIPPFDVDAYAGKLAELMSNPELRTQFARNGQENVARFSPEAIGDKWEKLLKEVAGK